MTGEITLHGRVLPIGGLREKSMAAYKNGMTTVLFPYDNLPDLEEVDAEVKAHILFIPVKTIGEVLSHALVSDVKKKADEEKIVSLGGQTFTDSAQTGATVC